MEVTKHRSFLWIVGGIAICLIEFATAFLLLGRTESPIEGQERGQIALVLLGCSATGLLLILTASFAFQRASIVIRVVAAIVALPLGILVWVGLINAVLPSVLGGVELSQAWNEAEALRISLVENGLVVFGWGCTALTTLFLGTMLYSRKSLAWALALATLIAAVMFGIAAVDMGWGLT